MSRSVNYFRSHFELKNEKNKSFRAFEDGDVFAVVVGREYFSRHSQILR